ncbi:hypothetical protein WDA79_21360, partial [Streptomyces sp. A475]
PVRQRVRRHVYVVWRADADRRPSIRAAVKALRGVGASLGGDVAAREGSPGEGSPGEGSAGEGSPGEG